MHHLKKITLQTIGRDMINLICSHIPTNEGKSLRWYVYLNDNKVTSFEVFNDRCSPSQILTKAGKKMKQYETDVALLRAEKERKKNANRNTKSKPTKKVAIKKT